jgi:hypothetical protein
MTTRIRQTLAAALLGGLVLAAGCRAATVAEPDAAEAPAKTESAGKAETPAAPGLEGVAQAYYKEVRLAAERDKAAQDRSTRDLWNPPPSNPRTATGTVVDLWGERVAGAAVVVRPETGDRVLGAGKTDDRGNFRVALSTAMYKGLTLEVTAPGFARWAVGGLYGGLVDQPVRMSREIDAAYFGAVAAEKDRGRRLRLLLDLVGNRQTGMPEPPEIYAQIGLVRSDLADLVRSKAFEQKDDPRQSPADRALWLLFFWQDAADADLFGTYAAANPACKRLDGRDSGETADKACRAYADAFFGAGQRTEHGFSTPVYGPDQDRALVEFTVRYAFWGYSQLLVLVKTGDRWTVKVMCDYRHFEFRRDR